jgi:hypothetical protein
LLELLQKAAYSLFLEGKEQFRESDLRRKLLAAWPELPLGHELRNRDTTSVIAEIKRDGILIQIGDQYDPPLLFLHRTFQEYLTACALAQQADCEGWWAIAGFIDKETWLPEWQEVIVLLAGQLRGPRPLLKMLSSPRRTRTNPHGDDHFRHRLAVAAQCLPEIPSEIRSRESEIVDRITNATFSLWWECIINGIAAAVPHLTHALPALGQVNGRMKGTPLLEWLSERLRDENSEVREVAAGAVGKLEAVAATPAILGRLSELLGNEYAGVREAAAEAVGRLIAQGVRIFRRWWRWEVRTVTELNQLDSF